MFIWKSLSKIASYNIELVQNMTDLAANSKDAKYMNDIEFMFTKASKNFTKKKQFDDLLIAMFAISVSVAVCDNHFSEEEKKDVENFLFLLEESKVSTKAKNAINKIYNKPPNFTEALDYVNKVNRDDWTIFDVVIDWMRLSDSTVSEEERKYKISWNNYKEKTRS